LPAHDLVSAESGGARVLRPAPHQGESTAIEGTTDTALDDFRRVATRDDKLGANFARLLPSLRLRLLLLIEPEPRARAGFL
jgi:hypothetical protein